MKKTLLILLSLLFCLVLSSCKERPDKPVERYYPLCETAEERAQWKEFVLECIENGRGEYDKAEPEELVEECRVTGREILCPQKCKIRDGYGNLLTCDSNKSSTL